MKFSFLFLYFFIAGGLAHADNSKDTAIHGLHFSSVARNSDGSARYMEFDEALKYCVSRGEHLPSVRELAKMMVAHGAKFAYFDDGARIDASLLGYYLVDAMNADGFVDAFYFNHDDYKNPNSDYSAELLWTSSRKILGPGARDHAVWAVYNYGLLDIYAPNTGDTIATACLSGAAGPK